MGPCHVWEPKTQDEKKQAQKEIDRLNAELEPAAKEQWELNTAMRRVGLRNKPGVKPQWRFIKSTGKLVRDSKGGINWYRYQKVC